MSSLDTLCVKGELDLPEPCQTAFPAMPGMKGRRAGQ